MNKLWAPVLSKNTFGTFYSTDLLLETVISELHVDNTYFVVSSAVSGSFGNENGT